MTPLIATIEQVQAGIVTLVTPDGQRLTLPEQAFHGTPTIGASARLAAVVAGTEANGEGPLAHALLNELLGSST